MTVPAKNEDGTGKDKIDTLCEHIVTHLRETTGRFDTFNKLADSLRAKGIHVPQNDLKPALERLANSGRIEWPDVPGQKSRPGWLTDSDSSQEEK